MLSLVNLEASWHDVEFLPTTDLFAAFWSCIGSNIILSISVIRWIWTRTYLVIFQLVCLFDHVSIESFQIAPSSLIRWKSRREGSRTRIEALHRSIVSKSAKAEMDTACFLWYAWCRAKWDGTRMIATEIEAEGVPNLNCLMAKVHSNASVRIDSWKESQGRVAVITIPSKALTTFRYPTVLMRESTASLSSQIWPMRDCYSFSLRNSSGDFVGGEKLLLHQRCGSI